MSNANAELIILTNLWSLTNTGWSVADQIKAIEDAGFEGFTCHFAKDPNLKELVANSSLRYGGFFDAGAGDNFREKIEKSLEIDNGPINCQLGDHDTPITEAATMSVELLRIADELGAEGYVEVHRDTATETPEKSYGIADAYAAAAGKPIRMNFDYSHPAIVKHLGPGNYTDRLIERKDLFQMSRLWHMRPFNGHHCQIPITDGTGNFSPEYEELRPFISDAFKIWKAGDYGNEQFWVTPELGPVGGYGLSCFPDIWQDTIVLGNDLKKLYAEA
jgi:hypothetical protein